MRSSLLALVMLLGCEPTSTTAPTQTPAASDPPPVTTPEPVAPAGPRELSSAERATWALLDVELPDKPRAVVAKRGALRFTKDGAVAIDGKGEPAWDPLPVVAVDGERVQIVTDTRNFSGRLLVWVDVADIAPQLQRVVALRPGTGAAKKGEGAVELGPGEEVEILERKEAIVRVKTRDDRFSGWIENSALGPTYTRQEFPMPIVDALLPGGATIAVRPNGRALAVLEPIENGKWVAHTLAPAKNGWIELEHVDLCHATVRVHGYARTKTVQLVSADQPSFGCAGSRGTVPMKWGDLESAEIVKLPADARLYAPDGALVGRTLGPAELRRGSDGLVRVPTFWGFVPVKVDSRTE
ncbi:MAG TPA: hypothetical protein VG755_24260 [Nannocystaceae bacterium]|nr:hypothetical protein [Nannocystaceae bacterium]